MSSVSGQDSKFNSFHLTVTTHATKCLEPMFQTLSYLTTEKTLEGPDTLIPTSAQGTRFLTKPARSPVKSPLPEERSLLQGLQKIAMEELMGALTCLLTRGQVQEASTEHQEKRLQLVQHHSFC